MQTELTQPGPLLDTRGRLAQVGWSRRPLLDCNLERARFYALRPLQRLRLKRWDYYALFTPRRFFSATIADLGYAGNIFVYTLAGHSVLTTASCLAIQNTTVGLVLKVQARLTYKTNMVRAKNLC